MSVEVEIRKRRCISKSTTRRSTAYTRRLTNTSLGNLDKFSKCYLNELIEQLSGQEDTTCNCFVFMARTKHNEQMVV
jgi:hypothetical protein